ncbi:endonuclease domain-containing 1 protein-like [Etheostoma cragini]|uniref:endonuclease domain-containing 1 protein-like n=1 Tax=Etheostoma cragini TaxID=417921 RepID=UPI00155E5AB3|nr:endonuclease domain-containing 1 protein-like [Etheostoma cragini]
MLTMTSLKMCSLLLLLLLTTVPTVTEVVRSMSDCEGFLLDETPPNVPGILEGGNILDQNRYKPICQTFEAKRCFVTLYDTTNRIPVFSAYKYTGSEGKRPRDIWRIELQLEDITDLKNMWLAAFENQALYDDYNKQGFDKGHLFPSSYGLTEKDKESTFALTNIVPQVGTFNQGSWSRMEKCVKCVLDKYCVNSTGLKEAFLVTGAQPGLNNINNRVNIPSRLWSAFCCYSEKEKGWLASAHWGENSPNTTDEYLQTKTLAELQDELGIQGFPGIKCPLQTTVTPLYPKLEKKECKLACPKPIPTTTTSPSSTSVPISTSSAPLSTTSVPISTSSAPLSTTSAPLSTTSAPLSSTSAPLSTTSAPLSTTSDPLST